MKRPRAAPALVIIPFLFSFLLGVVIADTGKVDPGQSAGSAEEGEESGAPVPAAESPEAPGYDFKILYPPDLTLTAEDTISVYGFSDGTPPPGGEVNIVRKFDLKGDEFVTGEAELFPGMNLVRVGSTTVRVFVLKDRSFKEFSLGDGENRMTFTAFSPHPALEEGCESCHTLEGSDITLNDEIRPLCFECHEDPAVDEEGQAYPFVHEPAAEEECTACHDPHFSAQGKLLTERKLCIECHDDKEPTEGAGGSVHKPVVDMECQSCHNPHASPFKYQLRREGTSLCFGCHGDITKDDSGEVFEYIHDPVEEGECFTCHEVHSSDHRKLLNSEKVCLECHDDKDPEGGEYASVHGPVGKKECEACHSPHASPHEHQLLGKGNGLCLTCHETPHKGHRSAKAEDTGVAVPDDFPVEKDGNFSCSGCHAPHFSKQRRLFPEPEVVLCVMCHGM